MSSKIIVQIATIFLLVFTFSACKSLSETAREPNTVVSNSYTGNTDTTNTGKVNWNTFFTDPNLVTIIDSALRNNQELNILLQEIQISKNEVRVRKGEYLPSINLGAGAGVDKVGRYTVQGATEATTEIEPGREMPDPVPNLMIGAYGTWEVDIWKKLRNAKQAAVLRYLSSVEGRNFAVTHLVAEISSSYYELLALDNQLQLVDQNIEIQQKALNIVKLQKKAAKVTELAVQKFEAEVLKNRSRQYFIRQQIVEMESHICYLMGTYPKHITRSSDQLIEIEPYVVKYGVPSQLLANRPDIKQVELQLEASKLDVKVAKARFYPSLTINAAVGLEAFDPTFLIKTPQSMLYSLAGELMAPLLNRNAIKAMYSTANSKQIQAVYTYEQTLLNAYIEVYNQVLKLDNLEKSYALQEQQVAALNYSIGISNNLFASARADYMEVLMTQRDALESKMELIETRKEQFNALVNMYQSLGGGWK